MPKINASLADVSTTGPAPFEPGVYQHAIRSIKESTKEGRTNYQFQLEVTGVVEDGNENAIGRKYSHFVHIHKTDGELNPFGLADIKRFFEAIAPDRANADDADTDELIDGEFIGQVGIKEYKGNKNNELDTRSIQAA